MKRYVLIVITTLYSCLMIAQKNEDIILMSLESLNKKFHLNLEKENNYIFVSFDDKDYICDRYKNNTDSIIKVKRIYRLQKISDTEYYFILKRSSEYNGSFKIIKENDKYLIKDIKYVKRDD